MDTDGNGTINIKVVVILLNQIKNVIIVFLIIGTC